MYNSDSGSIGSGGLVSMRTLPGFWRCAQVSIFLVFLADTYVYSMLDTLVGSYLGTLGLTQTNVSIAFSIYGIFQLVATVVLLLLHRLYFRASAVPDRPAGLVSCCCQHPPYGLLACKLPAAAPSTGVARGIWCSVQHLCHDSPCQKLSS